MSSINKISKLRVSEEVLKQLKSNIISGDWTAGSKIPGEMELAASFGVSRISVRQAIHQLVGMGLLVVKGSKGTFVNEIISNQYSNIFLPYLMVEQHDIFDVFEFRCIIEGRSAALAAERATSKDIKMLEETYKKLQEYKNDYDEFIKYDVLFHTIVATATKNSVIIKVISILFDLIKSTMREAVEMIGFKGLDYHLKVLEAIRKKDKLMAEKFMVKHVVMSQKLIKNTNIEK